jgi:hypothetical protein
VSTKRKRQTAEQIVSRGYGIGYSDIRVMRGGDGIEWGEPFDRDFAWEALVRRRADEVIAFLRNAEKERKAEEKAAAAKERRASMESLSADVARLRCIVTEIEGLKLRIEALEKASR